MNAAKLRTIFSNKKDMENMRMLSDIYEQNIEHFKKMFRHDSTFILREFKTARPNELKCAVMLFDGMVDGDMLNRSVIEHVMRAQVPSKKNALDYLFNHVASPNEIEATTNEQDIIFGLMSGDTIFICEGDSRAMVISSKGFVKRSPEEPQTDIVTNGPHEGFIEPMVHNIAMLRRKLKTHMLRVESIQFGTTVKTSAAVCFIEGVANDQIVAELKRRLDKIKDVELFDTNYIVERICDNPLSPFGTIGISERPDTVAAKLLEGRVGLVLDGCPTVITVPFLFIEYFQSSEDYSQNYIISSFGRMLRILCFFISVSAPGLYVAFLTFNPELIPTKLLVSIAAARSGVPFPILLETVLLMIAYEILRDASIRLSPSFGLSLSIVGALVLGDSAVQAKYVSAPLVIIIALTAITGLINSKIKSSTLVCQFLILGLSAILGIFGWMFGIVLILLEIGRTSSFGVDYSMDLLPVNFKQLKDTLIRAPWSFQNYHALFRRLNVSLKRKADFDEQADK